MRAAHWGLLAFLGFSVAGMGAAIVLWGGSRSPLPNAAQRGEVNTGRPPVPAADPSAHANHRLAAPARDEAQLERLLERLLELLGRPSVGDEDELDRIEQELLALGEQAAGPIVRRLRGERDSARRELLLNFLRKVPGGTAEAYLIEEARAGRKGSSRTLAIDALAERRTDAALDALDQIAKRDPDLPSRPFIAAPRQPGDDSTELPDEVNFTPRMKAMAALASTHEARAALTLSDVLRDEPDESLRMEAARNLGQLRLCALGGVAFARRRG
jgi:hypothetical protein